MGLGVSGVNPQSDGLVVLFDHNHVMSFIYFLFLLQGLGLSLVGPPLLPTFWRLATFFLVDEIFYQPDL